jgi:hypothetical protein
MIERLRPGRTEAEELSFYTARYPHGYDHTVWPDHVERIAASVAFIRARMGVAGIRIADLSCGDGAIVAGLASGVRPVLGDLLFGHADLDLIGPAADTVELIGQVDLLVCSETLEHLDDPGHFLRAARPQATRLFVSTPCGESGTGNPEHYWGWDQDGIRELLEDAGWEPYAQQLFTPEADSPYVFQFWLCS